MEAKPKNGHGSTFTLRGVVIPSTAGLLASTPKYVPVFFFCITDAPTTFCRSGRSLASHSLESLNTAAARPASATSRDGRAPPRRDLQVVITSDGRGAARPATTAGPFGGDPGARPALSRTNGRRVPVDPHADKFLARNCRDARGRRFGKKKKLFSPTRTPNNTRRLWTALWTRGSARSRATRRGRGRARPR